MDARPPAPLEMWMTGSFLECGGTGVTGVTAGTRHANVADLVESETARPMRRDVAPWPNSPPVCVIEGVEMLGWWIPQALSGTGLR